MFTADVWGCADVMPVLQVSCCWWWTDINMLVGSHHTALQVLAASTHSGTQSGEAPSAARSARAKRSSC